MAPQWNFLGKTVPLGRPGLFFPTWQSVVPKCPLHTPSHKILGPKNLSKYCQVDKFLTSQTRHHVGDENKKNLDKLKFVRLRTQTSHIDGFLTTLMTREILCVIISVQTPRSSSDCTIKALVHYKGKKPPKNHIWYSHLENVKSRVCLIHQLTAKKGVHQFRFFLPPTRTPKLRRISANEYFPCFVMDFGVRMLDRKNLNWCTPFFAVSQ